MKKFQRIVSALIATVMSVSIMAAPVSAEWYKTSNGEYFYTDSDGERVTGWQTIDGSVYYFNSKGIMQTGWLKATNGEKYYLKSDGKQARNCSLVINKVTYDFDKKGVATVHVEKKTAVKPKTTTTTTDTSDKKSQTVYITKTGSKYHRAGCRYLKKSCIETDLESAKKKGYSACSVCW